MHYSRKELKHFGLEILVVYGILEHFEHYLLNWLRYFLIYILGENISKIRKEKL